MLRNEHQQVLIEFVVVWVLSQALVNTVQKLHENRTSLLIFPPVICPSVPVAKLVSEANPLLLHKDHESRYGPVMLVHQHHWERGQLRRAVPPIATMDQHRNIVHADRMDNTNHRRHYSLNMRHPSRSFQHSQPGNIVAAAMICRLFQQHLVRFPYNVDIRDSHEHDAGVFVHFGRFVPFSYCLVCLGVK